MAHSGTVLGLLLDPVQADGPATAAYLAAHLPGLESISLHRMVGGGPRLAGVEQGSGEPSRTVLLLCQQASPGGAKYRTG